MAEKLPGSAAGQPSGDLAAQIAYGGGQSGHIRVPPRPDVNFDRLEALAGELVEVIHDHAATWETLFDGGVGDVVSVKDAAWVVAGYLLRKEAEGA